MENNKRDPKAFYHYGPIPGDDTDNPVSFYKDHFSSDTLLGFDFVEFLQRRHFIGLISRDMYALLVPIQNALEECLLWSGQDISRDQLLKYLKANDIHVFSDIDDFTKTKNEYQKTLKQRKEI